MKMIILVAVCLLAVMPLNATAASINYQGRFTAGGTDYTGPVWLKARAISMFSESLWANDGSAGTNEPAGSVQIEANGGLFNIELGNPYIPGMTNMDWKVFRDSECSLRIWLSTNNIAFERLSPDVSIRPATFEKLCSGRTIFVDDSDSADFRDLQSALNAVYNDEAESIIVLPGWYPITTPLTFSTQRFVNITGWGNRDEISIECTNGPAMFPHNVTLENLSFSGSPAVSDNDASVPASYRWEAHHCVFRNNSTDNPGSAAVELAGDGEAILFDCRIENNAASSGSVLEAGGSVEVRITHCELFAGSGSGPAAKITGDCGLRAIDCDFFSDGDLSLAVDAPVSTWFEIRDCRLQDGIRFSSAGGTNLAGGLFKQCSIGNNNSSAAAFNIDGSSAWLNFENCEIWAYDAPAVRQYAASGLQASVQLKNSHVYTMDGGAHIMASAIIVSNAAGNATDSVQATVKDCEMSADNGHGIDTMNAQVQIVNTRVQSNQGVALRGDGSDLSVEYSTLDGYLAGIAAMDAEIEISHSSVEGYDKGIYVLDCLMDVTDSSVAGGQSHGIEAAVVDDSCELFITRSSIMGSDSDEGAPSGSAIHSTLSPADPLIIFHSTLDNISEKPTLDLNGGMNIIEESILLAESGAAVELDSEALMYGTNTFVFDHCKFMNIGDSNTNALFQLNQGDDDAVVPVINGCAFRTLFGTGSPAIGMSTNGTSTTGAAIMADCYLGGVTFSTNAISLIPVDDTTLPYGNIIGY
ncbi:MAG: right-handed parallel beta-helix repeat-containing protein [Kiritimatiellia bacterium]